MVTNPLAGWGAPTGKAGGPIGAFAGGKQLLFWYGSAWQYDPATGANFDVGANRSTAAVRPFGDAILIERFPNGSADKEYEPYALLKNGSLSEPFGFVKPRNVAPTQSSSDFSSLVHAGSAVAWISYASSSHNYQVWYVNAQRWDGEKLVGQRRTLVEAPTFSGNRLSDLIGGEDRVAMVTSNDSEGPDRVYSFLVHDVNSKRSASVRLPYSGQGVAPPRLLGMSAGYLWVTVLRSGEAPVLTRWRIPELTEPVTGK